VGSILGVSRYLRAGTHRNVTIELARRVNDTDGDLPPRVIAMPHRDTNGNRLFDFVISDGSVDEPFTRENIWELERQPSGRYGLTDEQYEALVEAYQRGYFEVPLGITLAELAEELGVSHQALSERVRRGTGALVDDTLLIGSPRRTGEK
jgi:predicted DNA binding protein